jgi:hypothetical protein
MPTKYWVYPGISWGEGLTGDEDMNTIAHIRTNAHTGWSTGTPESVATIKQQIERCLTRQPAGKNSRN